MGSSRTSSRTSSCSSPRSAPFARARSRGLRVRAPVAMGLVALVAAGTVHAAGAPPAAAARHGVDRTSGWQRPVPGGVVRPFVEPASPYGPGHRGVDLAAASGATVVAAGRGTVVFAGDVAGARHVVVAHRGGLRTSYSFLLDTTVAVGDEVEGGAPVGRAGGTDGGDHGPGVVHFGLRVGDRYVDPMVLFRPRDLRELVRLVPVDVDEPTGSWARPGAAEATGLLAGLAPGGGQGPAPGADPGPGPGGCGAGVPLVGAVVSAACAGVDWAASRTREALAAGLAVLRDAGRAGRVLAARVGTALEELREQVARTTAALARQLLDTPLGRALRDVVEIGERFLDWTRRECSTEVPPADGTGGSGHLVMAVAGIDSSTRSGGRSFGLDVTALGYHDDEVHWFSYAGDGRAYEAEDTHQDLRAAAKRLADQLRALDAGQPGREVDLVAHSQGGVVVERFLRFEYDASDPSFPPIGTVVTLASPHEGAPLATTGRELAAHPRTRRVVGVLDRLAPGPPADARSVRQLAEGSPFLRRMRAVPLPEHVDLTTIGGTDDLVVPANRIRVPGATEVVVGVDGWNDHSNIPHDARALQAVRAALERRPPPCTSLLEGLRGAVAPVLLSRVEGDLGEYLTTYLEVGR